MIRTFLGGRAGVLVDDITKLSVDAVVNAANSSLLGGGGVDGAIHRAGGPAILAACQDIRRKHWPRGLPTGEAVITTAGALPARHVIHTVGPIWGKDSQPEALLASCYRRALELAYGHECRTVAFPAISTGVYGFPKSLAAAVASRTIGEALVTLPIQQVQLVFFSQADAGVFLQGQTFDSN